MQIVAAAMAYVLFLLYDLTAMKQTRGAYLVFFAGGLLMATATLCLILRAYPVKAFENHLWLTIFFLAAALMSLGLLIWVLFFSVPAKDTYVKGGKNPVVTGGWYALCRHPGVIFFGAFYLFIYLAFQTIELLIAFAVLTLLDIVYVAVQDQYIFPKTLDGYEAYQQTTPFILPSAASIKKTFGEMKQKRR